MSKDLQERRKPKKAAKRHVYRHKAQCKIGDVLVEAYLMNISGSGIQFATRGQIDISDPLTLMWEDHHFGEFNPTMLVAREVPKPENKEYQFYYGAQYYRLDPVVKEKLRSLIKFFTTEDKKTEKEQTRNVKAEYVFKVIDEGPGYLRKVLVGGGIPELFKNILQQIAEYEKGSFMLNDEISQCLQKMVVYNFHCNLFGMLIPIVVESPELKPKYFGYVNKVLEGIQATEKESEEVFEKISKMKAKEEEKSTKRKRLDESSNRLFYTKQGLLQSLVETFAATDGESPEFKNTFKFIIREYKKILEFTMSADLRSGSHRRNTSSKSVTDTIVDILIHPRAKKKSFALLLSLFFVFLIVVSMIMPWTQVYWMGQKLEWVDGLKMGIISAHKYGDKVKIIVRSDKWDRMPQVEKDNRIAKLVKLLKDDLVLESAYNRGRQVKEGSDCS